MNCEKYGSPECEHYLLRVGDFEGCNIECPFFDYDRRVRGDSFKVISIVDKELIS